MKKLRDYFYKHMDGSLCCNQCNKGIEEGCQCYPDERKNLVAVTSTLSLLRHRAVPNDYWGSTGIPDLNTVDKIIGEAEKVLYG